MKLTSIEGSGTHRDVYDAPPSLALVSNKFIWLNLARYLCYNTCREREILVAGVEMMKCCPVPFTPPVPRYPRGVRPRKAVITVNGKAPDENGNVIVGDIRRDDFSGVSEIPPEFTDEDVRAHHNELLARLVSGPNAGSQA